MWERFLSGRRAASAGIEARVPIIRSWRQTQRLESVVAFGSLTMAMSWGSRAFRRAGSLSDWTARSAMYALSRLSLPN